MSRIAEYGIWYPAIPVVRVSPALRKYNEGFCVACLLDKAGFGDKQRVEPGFADWQLAQWTPEHRNAVFAAASVHLKENSFIAGPNLQAHWRNCPSVSPEDRATRRDNYATTNKQLKEAKTARITQQAKQAVVFSSFYSPVKRKLVQHAVVDVNPWPLLQLQMISMTIEDDGLPHALPETIRRAALKEGYGKTAFLDSQLRLVILDIEDVLLSGAPGVSLAGSIHLLTTLTPSILELYRSIGFVFPSDETSSSMTAPLLDQSHPGQRNRRALTAAALLISLFRRLSLGTNETHDLGGIAEMRLPSRFLKNLSRDTGRDIMKRQWRAAIEDYEDLESVDPVLVPQLRLLGLGGVPHHPLWVLVARAMAKSRAGHDVQAHRSVDDAVRTVAHLGRYAADSSEWTELGRFMGEQ